MSSFQIVVALFVQVDVENIEDFAPSAGKLDVALVRVSGLDEPGGSASIDSRSESLRVGLVVLDKVGGLFRDVREFSDRFSGNGSTVPLLLLASLERSRDLFSRSLDVKDIVLPEVGRVYSGLDVGDEFFNIGRRAEVGRQALGSEVGGELEQSVFEFDGGGKVRSVVGRVT